MKKIIIILAVLVVFILLFRGCYNINITKKQTSEDLLGQILGVSKAIFANTDSIKAEVCNKKPIQWRWRDKVIYKKSPTSSTLSTPTPTSAPVTTQVPLAFDDQDLITKKLSETTGIKSGGSDLGVVSGGPLQKADALVFCITIGEPLLDRGQLFLFWELKNNLNMSVPGLVPNGTGQLANMVLNPGDRINGFIEYNSDNELKIRVKDMSNYHKLILGAPMPAKWVPNIRSNKTNWQDKPMHLSPDREWFVFRFTT